MNISKKTFTLDVHDFSPSLPGLDDILTLKELYPNFKITCFTIPSPNEIYCERVASGLAGDVEYIKKWWMMVASEECDWIELGVHGYSHIKNEMDTSYNNAIKILAKAEDMFETVGLDYKKIFVAPYFKYSYEAIEALNDRGYVVVFRKKPKKLPEGLKYYVPNWFYNRPIPETDEILGHGHLNSVGVRDSLKQCHNNILKSIPVDAKFNFISELYGKK